MTVRVSTDMVDSRSQLQFWREVVCDTFVPFAFEPRRGQSARFHGEVISEDLGVARLTTVISKPFELAHGIEVRVGVSIGGAPLGQDPEESMAKADVMLYTAKRDGRSTFRLTGIEGQSIH